MKKSYNQEVRGDLTRRVYRAINEVIRQLDDARGRSQCVEDLLQPSLENKRTKLHDYCSKLIFTDPVGYGRKGDELLWRKGYHDIYTTAKRLKKEVAWRSEEAALVQGLLISGIGYYQNWLYKLQEDYKLKFDNYLDFRSFAADTGLPKSKPSSREKSVEANVTVWAKESYYRCLIYLGDLNRYLLDVFPTWDLGIAERYYLQAVYFNYNEGRAFNQLGTLATTDNYNLDAVYYYLRCLTCKEPFQGAEGNMVKSLNKNKESVQYDGQPTPLTQILITNFLSLFECFYFDKPMLDRDIGEVCHQVLADLQQVLTENTLDDEILWKITLMAVICTDKLSKKDSGQTSTVNATSLSILSQLLLATINNLTSLYSKYDLTNKNKNRLSRLKRRRRIRNDSANESDGTDSDVEIVDTGELSSDESESDHVQISDEEEVSDEDITPSASNGHAASKSKSNITTVESCKELSKLSSFNARELFDNISRMKVLECIKVFADWLQQNNNIIKSCSKTARLLFTRLVTLLNLINFDNVFYEKVLKEKMSSLSEKVNKIPLMGDYKLRGLTVFQSLHDQLEWPKSEHEELNDLEETFIILKRIVLFGNHLANINETDIKYNKKEKLFKMIGVEGNRKQPNGKQSTRLNSARKGELMKNMGQLWLKAEVLDLESRISRRDGNFTPYLVVDSEALIEHIVLVKQLVGSRQFIVVIPAVVLAQLDECKRDSGRARETIRWLESQFQHGNRSLRVQKPQERFSLPLIKYPKKKDKEAWTFFQIAECCHYFSKQSEFQNCTNVLVTLLTGQRDVKFAGDGRKEDINKDYSPFGVAKNIGINMEHIETFHTKWKLSTKSHG